MDIKQLRYFSEIVKHGTISRAANSMYVSQPSLSMSMNKLEEELGFKLLERHDGVFKLTDAGEEFYRHVELLLSIYENMEDEVTYMGRAGSWQLKLGITEIFRAVIPELFEAFLEKNEDFNIKLVEGNTTYIIDRLRMHQLHFCLTTLDYLDEDMESILLQSNRHSLLIKKGHNLNKDQAVDLSTLSSQRLIYSEGLFKLDSFLKNNNLNFKNVVSVETIGTAVRLVKKGLGIAVLPKIYASNYTDDEVESLDIKQELNGPDLYLSYMKSRHLTLVIEDFMNRVEEELKE
ncbi:MAG TPA: LysR family transcriptional regulator [Candidatus Jeotgalicoccus stercoravium]|nr:LysR family transcriptional regulator [Candidatus Jeotgalicoccus stercoravium]